MFTVSFFHFFLFKVYSTKWKKERKKKKWNVLQSTAQVSHVHVCSHVPFPSRWPDSPTSPAQSYFFVLYSNISLTGGFCESVRFSAPEKGNPLQPNTLPIQSCCPTPPALQVAPAFWGESITSPHRLTVNKTATLVTVFCVCVCACVCVGRFLLQVIFFVFVKSMLLFLSLYI